ncbi:MAG: GTP-binding protein [Candidatus Thorarchaeota archaeon]|nr:GTP-binding protein [Candidatus Thorarchaeota archaeon]
MKDQDDGSRVLKSVLIGDGAVGKTSIRRNYLGEDFLEGHLATIGVDLATKRVLFDKQVVKFILWDLAGQPTFEKVRGHYYHGSNGIILVYSVVDRDSFDNASKWFVEAYRNMGALPPTVIVGNKIDLRPGADASKVVTTEEGEAFTKYFIDKLEVPAVFIETSAKTGEKIQDTFTHLLKMMSLAEKDDEFGIFKGDPGI